MKIDEFNNFRLKDVNGVIYTEADNFEDFLYIWNYDLEDLFSWLITYSDTDERELFEECIKPAQNLDDILRIVKKVNELYPGQRIDLYID